MDCGPLGMIGMPLDVVEFPSQLLESLFFKRSVLESVAMPHVMGDTRKD